MTMLTTDLCDLIRELRSHFFAKDRDVIVQTNRIFAGTSGGAGTIPVGGIILWSGSVVSIPTGWALCDGGSGTPNLTDSFVVCAGGAYAVAATGGEDASNLAHTHGPGTLNTDNDSHTHGPGTLATDYDIHDHGPGTLNTDNDSHTHGPGNFRTGEASATVGNDNADGVTYPIVQQSHTHDIQFGDTAPDSHDHDVDSGLTATDTHNHDLNAGVTASDSHDHAVDSGVTASAGSAAQENRPVYYALAYIMRTA